MEEMRQIVGIVRIWKYVRLYYQVLPRNKESNIAEGESAGALIIKHGI